MKEQIGNIRIESLLGAGGMGEVYRGFDTRLERVVAVKTLNARHRLDGEAKARFLREAKILSRLESSAICRVFDLVEGEEADYLIFEYVEGESLRQVLDQRRLDSIEALELAEKIANALAVAHAERIVHRDLKPANIMVTPEGDIKILDFGISHAVREGAVPQMQEDEVQEAQVADLAADSLDTVPVPPAATVPLPLPIGFDEEAATVRIGGQGETVDFADGEEDEPGRSTLGDRLTAHGSVVGTLAYMSPEQAVGQDLTEASDLFSLGLILQEMLDGRPAYEPVALGKLFPRVIMGRTRSFETQGLDPDAVRLVEHLQRRDLEQRPTALETAEQLRYILDRPKREQRQRRMRLLATASFVVLLGVLVVVSVLAVRADRAAKRAELEAQRAEAQAERANQEAQRAGEVVDFLVQLFDAASPENARGREVSVREIVDVGAVRIEQDLHDQPLVRARLQDTLGTILWQLGDYPAARHQLEEALEVRRQELPSDAPELALGRQHLASVLADQGEFEDSQALLRSAVEGLEEGGSLEGEDLEDEEREAASVLSNVLNDLATLRFQFGDFEAAEKDYQRALELRTQLFGPDSIDVARILNNLAVLSWQLGDYEKARSSYQRSLAVHESMLGADHPDLSALLNNLGILERNLGRAEAAVDLHGRALAIATTSLGDRHRDVAAIQSSYALALVALDRLEEAQPLFESAYAIQSETLGADSFEIGRTLGSLGDLLRRRGELDRARSMLQRARRLLAAQLGEDHPWTLKAVHALANTLRDTGELDQARILYQQALAVATESLGPDHPDTQAMQLDLESLEAKPPDSNSATP